MSTVAKLVGIRTGPSGAEIGAQRAAAQAQATQAATIAQQSADADKVLAGQQKVANGGSGFLSFLDDDLKKLFGG
ncbi:hypothetical protein [Hyphomicrobium sp. DY-1]|uniref:hypothetical protein n=1 Tax=Hyphomicrobium sp. DY-1 TaxID=3075650 RepID=UPI0039C4D3E7